MCDAHGFGRPFYHAGAARLGHVLDALRKPLDFPHMARCGPKGRGARRGLAGAQHAIDKEGERKDG